MTQRTQNPNGKRKLPLGLKSQKIKQDLHLRNPNKTTTDNKNPNPGPFPGPHLPLPTQLKNHSKSSMTPSSTTLHHHLRTQHTLWRRKNSTSITRLCGLRIMRC